jgi:UDP-GlcNAc3NAcA epimerase
VGARPNFVKAAPVARALDAAGLPWFTIHTGQHYDPALSDRLFEQLELRAPEHHLGVGSGLQGEQTARMLAGVERVLLAERPGLVLVYGDTNSTLAGALAAVKLGVPLVHVEAGLRSFNRRMPEEINRVLVDHAADLLLAPTEAALAHLRREGLPEERLALVGDVMYDAALLYGERAAREHDVGRLGLTPRGYVLATAHRAENTDDPARLRALIEGLAEVARELPVVLPLHPRTRAALARQGLAERAERALRLIEPVGFLEMLALERHARLVATDSGGVQKEAFFQGVPCVTLRDETEWVELIESGWNRLVPPRGADAVAAGIRSALEAGPGRPCQPYGDGHAAGRIVELLRPLLAAR